MTGARAADVGCGFDGALGRLLFSRSAEILLIDVSVDRSHPDRRITIVEGYLPGVLGEVESECLDAIVCNNVIEHLWEPAKTLGELYRVLAPGGRLIVNVPSWRGKFFLELAAFRLGLAPKQEMDDHKTYYDPSRAVAVAHRGGLPSEQRELSPPQVRSEHHRSLLEA